MTIVVAGARVAKDLFIEALQKREPEAERLLVRHLRGEHRGVQTHSEGLLLLQHAFRRPIIGWLQQKFFVDDPARAEEAWNDALYRVWSRIDSYVESRSRFTTWVWNQARWAALDLQRKPETGRHILYAGDEESEEAEEGEKRPDLLTKELQEEARRSFMEPEPLTRAKVAAVRRAFQKLKQTDQLLLHLRFVCDFSNVEVAQHEALGRELPADHVRVYVNRAAKRLRRFYDAELGVAEA